MTGAVKTMDKLEEKSRQNVSKGKGFTPVIDTGSAIAGEYKHAYGESHDINTDEGYYAGKQQHEEEQAKKKAADDMAEENAKAQAAQAAAEASALEKNQASQREALKRKGRRASILTSAQGATDPLGVPGA